MTSDPSTTIDPASIAFGVIGGILGYLILAYLVSRIFKKADVPAWIAFVPVYNNWTFFRLGGFAGWWALVAFIPFVNVAAVIVFYVAQYRVARSLQKSGLFVLWAIFIPLVYFVWLAFDRSVWSPLPGETRIIRGSFHTVAV